VSRAETEKDGLIYSALIPWTTTTLAAGINIDDIDNNDRSIIVVSFSSLTTRT